MMRRFVPRCGEMIDQRTFSARLERLREYLDQLRSIRASAREAFVADPILRAAGERYLHLALESALDIGNHIIAERGYPRPETYAAVLTVLADKGILPDSIYRDLDGMAAFRHLLVHDYARLDHGRIYDVLVQKYPVLEALFECYVRQLDDQPGE